MSTKDGFQTIRVSLNNIPNTQASGVWSQNGTKLTSLDKGVYLVTYNISYIPSVGPITNSQTVITSGLSFTGGGSVIAATPLTGALALTGLSAMRQTLTNVFIITANDTPIFLYLSCIVSAGFWGTTLASEAALNIMTFTKIGSV
jgi:hypothetical protein